MKKYDSAHSDSSLDIAGVIYPLTDVSAGDNYDNRTGIKVVGKYIAVNMVLNNGLNDGLTGFNTITRVLVVRDRQMDGNATTIAEVLATVNINSFLNATYIGRYDILYDKRHALNSTTSLSSATPAQAIQQKHIKIYRKLKDVNVQWTSAAGTSYSNGHIWLILIPLNDEVGGFGATARFGFVDP